MISSPKNAVKKFLPEIFGGAAPSHAEFSNNFACNERKDKDSL